jgi:hypothetical protein
VGWDRYANAHHYETNHKVYPLLQAGGAREINVDEPEQIHGTLGVIPGTKKHHKTKEWDK